MRFVFLGFIMVFFLVTVGGFLAMLYKDHKAHRELKPKKMSSREIKEQKKQEIDTVLRKAIRADLQSDEANTITSVKHDILDILGSLDKEMAQYTEQQYEMILKEETHRYREHTRNARVLDKIDTHRSVLRKIRSGEIIE